MMSNSLEVSQDGTSIHTVRRWLGVPVRRKSMHRSQFAKLRKKSSMNAQKGGKHVIYYAIHMVDQSGDKMVVGQGFRGESEANAAKRLIAKELGLRLAPEKEKSRPDTSVFEEDVLSADF